MLIASGFGSGLVSKAPGTVGSAACIAVWALFYKLSLWDSVPSRLVIIAVITSVGVWAINQLIRTHSLSADPSFVVIDEWAGMLVTLVALPRPSLMGIFLAFAFFRLFDILKPGPIGWCESLPGAWGVMADDLAAGVCAALCVAVSLSVFP